MTSPDSIGGPVPPRSRRVAVALTAVVLGLTVGPRHASAQGVRGWVGSTVQAVELRPLVLDTVSLAGVTEDASGRRFLDGELLTCVTDDICTRYRPGGEAHAVASTNDVSLTAWGFGLQGLSFTTLLRVRANMGSELLWPRSDDDFDALLGYAQYVRGPVKVRAGRQEIRSGLGFSAFDGGSASFTFRDVGIEGYGGRSLARGLREPTQDALSALESYVPDQSVYLAGGALRARVSGTSLVARYQREILADRTGLASERGSLDVNSAVQGLRISGSMDYDFAGEEWGKGHLTLSRALADGHVMLEVTGRRYVPYFQLYTIWGFFEPVSYSEAVVRLGWSPSATFGVWGTGGRRYYEDTNTTTVIARMEDDGWRADAGFRVQLVEGLSLDGRYELEWGPGSTLNSGDVSARYEASERFAVSASFTTFQQIDEFRVGDGRAVGGGLSFDLGITERITLAGGGSLLRHRGGDTTLTSPWNQTRGWSALRIAVGEDPGIAARRAR